MAEIRLLIVDKEINFEKRNFYFDRERYESDMDYLYRQYEVRKKWREKISEAYAKIYGTKFVVLAVIKYLLVIVACAVWLAGINGIIFGVIIAFLLRNIDILTIQTHNLDHLIQAESNMRVVLEEIVRLLKNKGYK